MMCTKLSAPPEDMDPPPLPSSIVVRSGRGSPSLSHSMEGSPCVGPDLPLPCSGNCIHRTKLSSRSESTDRLSGCTLVHSSTEQEPVVVTGWPCRRVQGGCSLFPSFLQPQLPGSPLTCSFNQLTALFPAALACASSIGWPYRHMQTLTHSSPPPCSLNHLVHLLPAASTNLRPSFLHPRPTPLD